MLPSVSRRTSRVLMGLTILAASVLPGLLAARSQVPGRAMYSTTGTSQWASVSPLTISANQNASVTVSAMIPAQYGTSLAPHVYRLDRQTGAATDLGVLRPGKAPPTQASIPYVAAIPFHETAAGQILLQVRVPITSVNRDVAARTASSPTMTVTVLAAAGGNNNPGGGVGGWLGGLVNGIVNSLGQNSNGGQNPDTVGIAIETPTISIRYPNGWTFNQELVGRGGPISIRNFPNYQQGGVVPQGGAEIEITSAPLSAASIGSALAADTGSAAQSSENVGGVRAVRATYADQYPGFSLNSVAVYAANGRLLYKFFLTWRTGDPNQASYLGSFNTVLQTVRFK